MTRCRLLLLFGCVPFAAGGVAPRITSATAGPYRVEGNRIVDANGSPYLVRGTEMPVVTLKTSDFDGDGKEFGPFSRSSFATIRHRLNMNAIRLPVNAALYEENPDYRTRVQEAVRRANRFELLVILGADGENEIRFWAHCAGQFKDNPNVFLALPGHDPALVDAIRATGARQPIIVRGVESQIRDPNIIYEVTPRYATTRSDEDRWRQFGSLAEHSPVLVNDLDPKLDRKSEECAEFPSDPGVATSLVVDNLKYFDAHNISWTLSSFRPGRMITEYRFYNWSKLDYGWTCGEFTTRGGIAMILLSHL